MRTVRPQVLLLIALVGLTGCSTPISADRVPSDQAYKQAGISALSGNSYSSTTRQVLLRYDLEKSFEKAPAETLNLLHEKACVDARNDLLYALAELNYLHASRTARSLRPWTPKNAPDYYLASAVYAYFYLFKKGDGSPLEPFDPRTRVAADLYNFALAKAFQSQDQANGAVSLTSSPRSPPQGVVTVQFNQPGFPWKLADFDRFLAADEFAVRGLSVRNREFGLGAPLIGIKKKTGETLLAQRIPATIFLRVSGDVRQWRDGRLTASLELYSGDDRVAVEVAGHTIPLKTDTTAPIADALNEQSVWKLGMAQFFSATEVVKTGVYPGQPYEPGRVPVVFVHGTFSSPVWWAEMANTLAADRELRQKCQFWYFIYNSGNPIAYSAVKLRQSLAAKVKELDPAGQDPALQQMVVIGHSQGGLLCKLTATDTGDTLWQTVLKTNRLEDLGLTTKEEALIRRYMCFKALPFVTRTVFVATPHRGSYLAGNFARRLAHAFVSLPAKLVNQTKEFAGVAEKLDFPGELKRTPTSLDGMAPTNPFLLALADIPLAPGVKGHSIIAVKGDGDYHQGKDGLVSYASAHVDYVESEFIVRSPHSCQGQPLTIEEVRRILHEHLSSIRSSATNSPPAR